MTHARGLYAITNIVSGTVYYGQSRHLGARLHQHKYDLRSGRHSNRHLQSSWIRYGEKAFVFAIVHFLADGSDLTSAETRCISDAYSLGLKTFNIREPEKAAPLCAETRAKLSAARKGQRPSIETRRKISLAGIGRVPTAATRAKLSASGRNRIPTAQALAHQSAAMKGRVLSAAHRAKLSVTHKRDVLSAETLAKMSAGQRRRYAHVHAAAYESAGQGRLL